MLELASFPYEHITAFAERWTETEWWGTVRHHEEVSQINVELAPLWGKHPNLHPARRLDIGSREDWNAIRHELAMRGPEGPKRFSGVVMLNLIHCCPPEYPAHVFQSLSPLTEDGRTLLDPEKGWIGAYGAFKHDDGSYKTSADEEFDRTYIKAKDESLGLRTIKSITGLAEKWGFSEESRRELPKGNMLVIWRIRHQA